MQSESTMSNLPEYAAVKQALASAAAVATTAESHGLLTGLFCSGKISDISAEKWAESSVGEIKHCDESLTILRLLFEVTHHKLEQMDFSFELLLPDDETILSVRAQELGAWCIGFIHGLQLGQVDLTKTYPPDCQDALQRIGDIAQIEYDNVNFSNSDEEAYVSVVEYVRLAVLVVYMELVKKPVHPSFSETDSTIH